MKMRDSVKVSYADAQNNLDNGDSRVLFLRALEREKPGYVADLTYSEPGVGEIGYQGYLRYLLETKAIDPWLYYPATEGLRDESLMFYTFTAPSRMGRHDPQKIFVKPRAFEILTEEEFLNGLCKHEYTHAEEGCLGIPVSKGERIDHSNIFQLQPETVQSVREIRAHLNELEGLIRRGLRDSKAYSNALHGVRFYSFQLLGMQPANPFENKVRTTFLKAVQDRLAPLAGKK